MSKFKDYTIKMSGCVELFCEHGIGHPSKQLTEFYRKGQRFSSLWDTHNSIHGCDGCCSDPEFKKAEEELLKQWRKI